MCQAANAATPDLNNVDLTLCRSLFYGLLAEALCPPTPAFLYRLGSLEALEALEEAAAVVEGGPGPLSRAVASLAGAAGKAETVDTGLAYQALFGHTARGKVPPYETEYGPGEPFQQAQEIADINGFYHAFGLAVPASRRQRCDHFAAECEFLSFLCRREAYQAAEGDLPASGEAHRVQRLFLLDHLGRFGRAFATSLQKEAAEAFYRAVGDLCLSFLEAECERLGVPPGAEFIQLRSSDEIDVPMACGGCKLSELLGARDGEDAA